MTWVEPLSPAILVFFALSLGLFILRSTYQSFGPIKQGMYIEAWGTLFDIIVVGVVLTLFATRRDRKVQIERYREEIDDFKKWDTDEGQLRIAGNIRRLAKMNQTDIDFSGIVLRNFSFPSKDINNLRGATFYSGLSNTWSKNGTVLENVSFYGVDCTGAIFSRSLLRLPGSGLSATNLDFGHATLIGASFDGANLSWTNHKADENEWHEDFYYADDEPPARRTLHEPAFFEADLKNCSFRNARLAHADFRYAINVNEADFTGAQGLETCFFDEGFRPNPVANKSSS